MGPADLAKVLGGVEFAIPDEVAVGIDTRDDAAVWRLGDGRVCAQTVDFFTPVVNDPYLFGQIAAANALSDIFAMGLEPAFALSVAAFPCALGIDILADILAGGNEKIEEAGAAVIGGHTVDDDEPKYGFCVTAFGREEDILPNSRAIPGDLLYLTKPLGNGILATALKADLVSESDIADAIESMVRLNRHAAAAAKRAGVRALTDVTGFGLAGHAHEMAAASGVAILLDPSTLPIFETSRAFVEDGIMPAGLQDNKRFLEPRLRIEWDGDPVRMDLLFDPQTSGGLLIPIAPDRLALLERALGDVGELVACVGAVVEGEPGDILLTALTSTDK